MNKLEIEQRNLEFNKQLFRLENNYGKAGQPLKLTQEQTDEFFNLFFHYDLSRIEQGITAYIQDPAMEWFPKPSQLLKYMPPPRAVSPSKQLTAPLKTPAQTLRDRFWGEFSMWMINSGGWSVVPERYWGYKWVEFLTMKRDGNEPKYKPSNKRGRYANVLVPFINKTEKPTDADIELLEGIKENWVNS